MLEAHVFTSYMNVIAGEGEDAEEAADEEVDHPVKRPAEEEVQFCPILKPSIYNSLSKSWAIFITVLYLATKFSPHLKNVYVCPQEQGETKKQKTENDDSKEAEVEA